ncbi:ISAs1 family transposase [Leekyejoonella antrihumi]|uniref:ISAs1 family transposase n=1 Tax=Leekyejoonella antrihumi TaxID=1660198 RepID=UPI001644104A|nr:ISAs1 family transposase [Leekyejoonella antrihumi]
MKRSTGGDYVLTVKGNTPTLRAKLKKLPWKDIPATSQTTRAHGQRATRTTKVTEVPHWVDFPGAAQVAQLRRTVTCNGAKTIEVVYLITSASSHDAPPDVLAGWARGHRGVENRLHYVRDSTLREDLSQVRTGRAPRTMATVRSTVIGLLRMAGWDNIAAGLRHHARHPEQAITLLLTC